MELILLWLVMAIICGMVASSKNRSFFLYFLGGLILWPIVLVAAILGKPRAEKPNPFDYPAEKAQPQPAPGAPFVADGMIGTHPYRREGDAVVVLINGTQVRFDSYETARREIVGTA